MISRRGVLAGLLVSVLASTALSQSIPWPGPGTPAAAGGGGYTGPGDVVAGAAMFAGLRAYTAAIAAGGTQKLINLRRASDNGTCDVLVASSGGLGLTANCAGGPSNGTTASVMCNATTCSVPAVYDQVNVSNSLTQGTAASQPGFSATGGPSSNPTLTFSVSGPLISVTGPTVPTPWTAYFVGQSTITGQGQWLQPATTAQIGFNYPGANTAYIYDSVAVSTSAPINTYYAVFGTEDGSGNMSIAVNGAAATTGSGGIHTTWSGTYWGYNTTGNSQEIAVWPGVLNNAQQNALATNARSNWGF